MMTSAIEALQELQTLTKKSNPQYAARIVQIEGNIISLYSLRNDQSFKLGDMIGMRVVALYKKSDLFQCIMVSLHRRESNRSMLHLTTTRLN